MQAALNAAPVFTALADPMRRQLLTNLAQHGPRTTTQLATQYAITRQGILKHLRVLETAGLVAVRQQGREKRYTLTPEPLAEVNRWTQSLNALWDKRLNRLKTLLESENEASSAP